MWWLGLVMLLSYAKGNLDEDIQSKLTQHNSTSLARTRRYLVFPEGSSFQVVFDLAYPTLDQSGLFVFGNTAGLAWELPSKPVFLDKKFEKKEQVTTPLPPLEHPAVADRDSYGPVSEYVNPFDSYLPQYQSYPYPSYSRQQQVEPVNDWGFYHRVHRRSRRDLYFKLEEFFSALMKDGKSCILKTICQVHKQPKDKGNFFEELLKMVFKVKPDDFLENEDHYDHAANRDHDCDSMYPECEGVVFNRLLQGVLKNK